MVMERDVVSEAREVSESRYGAVVQMHANPAYLKRLLEILWHKDHIIQEVEELEFGPRWSFAKVARPPLENGSSIGW
jgi:hypothetical protein